MHIDTKTVELIQNSLRKASIIWHIRAEVLKEAKIRVRVGDYKNGKPKFKVKYVCKECEKPHDLDFVEVDHIVEVANGLSSPSKMTKSELFLWISQLFCDKDNLQVLCKGCHANKTMRFRGIKKLRGMR